MRINYDTMYNADRNAELQRRLEQRREREKIEERARFWRDFSVFLFMVLLIIIADCAIQTIWG